MFSLEYGLKQMRLNKQMCVQYLASKHQINPLVLGVY